MAVTSLSSAQSDYRVQALWRSCLSSALRTAVACSIVACITLYGPTAIKRQVALPAFSYVTVILIVTDATLGDTLRGCWCALYATTQGVCPAILSLWLIGPARLTAASTAAATALSAFVVVLPQSTHLIAKRIALGQIVLVYVIAYIDGEKTEPIMHPVHVAASTAVGALACILALLLPYPSLACYRVKRNCKHFTDNAAQRLKLFVKAFCTEDKTSALALISQGKSLSTEGAKQLQNVKAKQESMYWESLSIFRTSCSNPGQRLQDIETPLKGMEIALSNSQNFPLRLLNVELKDGLDKLRKHISKQMKSIPDQEVATVPESNAENVMQFLQTLHTIPITPQDLPTIFFLFCLKLLQSKSLMVSSTNGKEAPLSSKKLKTGVFKSIRTNISLIITTKRVMPALKCALSLGLSVFLGALYCKKDAYWSGLPVAISLAAAREATFKVANVKAQGTVLGSIYGVLGCFLFEKYVRIRYISLLPWFLITSYLRRSRMYGQAGGISAVIGGVLILGRVNFGNPSDFAIARITETFIGLSCSIVVEILMQPTRASTLAKTHLGKSLKLLNQCVGSINIDTSDVLKMEETQKDLKAAVNELGNFISEAEAEPNFWFLPFHGACYGKLFASLSNTVQFLLFGSRAIRFLQNESGRIQGRVPTDSVDKLNKNLKVFKDLITSSISCFQEVTSIESLLTLEKQIEKMKVSPDLELGKSPPNYTIRLDDKDGIEKTMLNYLQNSKELIDEIRIENEEEEIKGEWVLGLSALAFCMDKMVSETKEIEKSIKELVQWENPSKCVNLHDILCKLYALRNSEINELK